MAGRKQTQTGVVKIGPSILSADFGRLGDEAAAVEAAGADFLHVDVMDGEFVPNLTIGPMVVKALRKTVSIPLDVHLMIVRPERYLQAFADAGADVLTVHVEATNHLHRALQMIRDLGIKAGVSLNPATPVSSVFHVLDAIDLLLVMTVNPGFGGQTFIRPMLFKIAEAAGLCEIDRKGIVIEVDGGVCESNASDVVAAGGRWLVAGNAVFGQKNYPKAIRAIRRAGEKVL